MILPPGPADAPIEAALAAAERLLALLQQEHALLCSDDPALAALAADKARLLDELHALAPTEHASGHARRAELERLITRCHHQNELNGTIIRARLRRAERGLAILRGETPDPSSYSRRGEGQPNTSARSLARA